MLRQLTHIGLLTLIAAPAPAQPFAEDGADLLIGGQEELLLGGPDDAEVIATPVSSTQIGDQPVATYDTRTGAWVPDCNATSNSWMEELQVPPGMIDCSCDGAVPGRRVRVWRSFVKPTDPSIDPKCVTCVKEPCLDYVTVEEEHRVVVFRCFESTEPFKHEGCERGHWYEAKGETRIRKLHPCEAKVPLKYQKPVIRYRDVYYYIQCEG